MLSSWNPRMGAALAGTLLSAGLWAASAAALPVQAPGLALARRGVQLTLGGTIDDSTHVTVLDAATGQILQQRWYVQAQVGAPLELEAVRPAHTGRVTLEVQVAGQAPEQVQVWLLPNWSAVIPLLLTIAVFVALRRLAAPRGVRPHAPHGSRP